MFGMLKRQHGELEEKLGYRFRNQGLLTQALTHRSYRFENEGVTSDNQRLEFLGDAVLGFLTAAYVYECFDESDEGVMTAFRSQTTSGRALSGLAMTMDLGAHLLLGKGEINTGGRERASNLADALESVIGAAYIDGGIKAATRVFRRLFVPELEGLSGDVWDGNPKGKLQEYAQRVWKQSPQYRVIKREGPAHDLTFTVELTVGDTLSVSAVGRNKQDAATQAAHQALELIRRRKADSGEAT